MAIPRPEAIRTFMINFRPLVLCLCLSAIGCQADSHSRELVDGPWAPRVAEIGLSSVLRIVTEAGAAGSGFFIHPAGLAVTNAHVVSGTDRGTVQMAAGDAPGALAQFEVIARGDSRDLALLRVHIPQPVDALPLGLSASLGLGAPLLAVGAPQGMFPVVTTGVLSGRSRPGFIGSLSVPEQLIHSAATLRGSSGCPILSAAGRVVGIQAAKPGMELVQLAEPSGETGVDFDTQLKRWSIQTEGFGLAIPIEDLRSFAPGWVAPEWSTGLATGFACDPHRLGCYVIEVTQDSPAEAAGLCVGDLIARCNGKVVLSIVDLAVWLNGEEPLSLGVIRDGDASVINFERSAWGPPPSNQLNPGLLWRELSGVRSRLGGLSFRDAVRTGTAQGPRLTPRHHGRDAFSLEYKAWIDVPEAGRWVFELASDDGSQLYVRDKLIVDCDGLHGKSAIRGEIELEAGLHPICLLFFESGGEEVLEARWGLVGETLRAMPDSAFFHRANSGW